MRSKKLLAIWLAVPLLVATVASAQRNSVVEVNGSGELALLCQQRHGDRQDCDHAVLPGQRPSALGSRRQRQADRAGGSQCQQYRGWRPARQLYELYDQDVGR